jgi:hypothetical protein
MKNEKKYNSGSYRKHFQGKDYEYQSFLPSSVNCHYEWEDKRILPLLF